MNPPEKRAKSRLDSIDTARGIAMLFVFLSHFSYEYLRGFHRFGLHPATIFITRIATPSFVLLSGTVLGLLRDGGRGPFWVTRDKLIDRGLFLILICHPLIALAHFPTSAPGSTLSRLLWGNELYITDTIGFSLVCGAVIAQYFAANVRVTLGAVLLLTSWTFEVDWVPSGAATQFLKEVLFGRLGGETLCYGFPFVPWFGVYLLGSAFGSLLARARKSGDIALPVRFAFRTSGTLLGLVLLAKVVERPLKGHATMGAANLEGRLLHLLSIGEKIPPSFAYLAFYCGLAMAGIGWLLRLELEQRLGPIEDGRWRQAAAAIGRNSLIVFVLQFYVYYTAVPLLPKPPLWVAPFYFSLTVVLLYAAAKLADKHRLNSYFRIGFARCMRSLFDRAQPSSVDSIV